MKKLGVALSFFACLFLFVSFASANCGVRVFSKNIHVENIKGEEQFFAELDVLQKKLVKVNLQDFYLDNSISYVRLFELKGVTLISSAIWMQGDSFVFTLYFKELHDVVSVCIPKLEISKRPISELIFQPKKFQKIDLTFVKFSSKDRSFYTLLAFDNLDIPVYCSKSDCELLNGGFVKDSLVFFEAFGIEDEPRYTKKEVGQYGIDIKVDLFKNFK